MNDGRVAPVRALALWRIHLLAWPLALALLLTACGFWSYTPDDGFIHLTFIRNLARSGKFVFAGHRATYGDTSPLWVLVNAIPVFMGAQTLLSVKIVGFFAGVASLWAAVLVSRRIGGRTAGTLAGLLLVTDPWVLRWTASGLETPLGVAVLLAALLALHMSRWQLASLLAGLAPLVRPDFVPFTVLVGVVLLTRHLRGPEGAYTRWQYIGSLALLLVPGMIWGAYAYVAFGTVVPNTVKVKSLQFDRPLVAWFRALAPILVSSHGVVLAALLGALVLKGRSVWARLDSNLRFALLAWPVLLFGGYLLSRSAVVSRYFLPATAFLYVAAACAFTAMSRRLAIGIVALSCTVSIGLILWRVKPEINEYSRNFVQARRIPMWLNDHASSGDVVAAGDIGYLGFYNQVGYDILDMAGLVTPEMVAPPEARSAYVRMVRPRFIVEREEIEDAVLAGRGLPMMGLDAEETRRAARLEIATFLGSPHMQRPQDRVWYSLYRLDWSRLHSATDVAPARPDRQASPDTEGVSARRSR